MSITTYDQKLFADACQKIVAKERETNGIGTLKEKTMHAVLKNFYEPDISHQEIKVGRFVADILRDDEIIEIQTRSFNAMRKKLSVFLEKYPVTIVYPIPHNKWLYWIDEDTGEVSKKRKSPKTGTFFDAFIELYKIDHNKTYLTDFQKSLDYAWQHARDERGLFQTDWSGTDKSDKKWLLTQAAFVEMNLQ